MLIYTVPTIIILIAPSYADIYKYVDENGVALFTNIPRDRDYERIIPERHKDSGKTYLKKNVTIPTHYNQIITSKSRKYKIEPSLVKAIITAESNWQLTAVSEKGAIGLMQLMPTTIRDMHVTNPFDPEENIEGGIKYLRQLLDKFNNNLRLALAAYNAGPDSVRKFGGMPPIPETKKYVKNVLLLYKYISQDSRATTIYKVTLEDGTILYTNTPSSYKRSKLTEF